MNNEDDLKLLPHSADCACRICLTWGPGLREKDIWRDPVHVHIIRLIGLTDDQHAYHDALTKRMCQLQAEFYCHLEMIAREQLKAEGWEA